MPSIIDEALGFAAELDALLGAEHGRLGADLNADDAMEQALVHQVGDLAGGLGCDGFVADLRGHLEAQIEPEHLEYEYVPYGSTYVQTGAQWLTASGERAQECAAEAWLTAARRIVADVRGEAVA